MVAIAGSVNQSAVFELKGETSLNDLIQLAGGLSTVAAERTLIEMDFSRKKRAGKIDSAAAAFILQGALDRLRALKAPSPSSGPDRP